MGRVGKIGVVILTIYSFITASSYAAERWYPNIEEGLKVAKEQNRLVMFYFYEDGCTYCKYMEEVVFVEPEVDTYMNSKFIVVPVDVENLPENLDRRFIAFGTPTFILYNPKTDKIVMQIFGLQESDEFLKLLSTACKKAKLKEC